MHLFATLPPALVNYLIIPVLIMLARICDVSIGTIRIIFVSRGERSLASVMGFFEVLIWAVVASHVLRPESLFIDYVAYAAGFALGNFVGISIERKLAMGIVSLRIITDKGADELIEHLKQEYHGVTSMAARGMSGEVKLIFAIIKRKDITHFTKLVKTYNPRAYISIEDVRTVSDTHLPPNRMGHKRATTLRRFRFSLRRK